MNPLAIHFLSVALKHHGDIDDGDGGDWAEGPIEDAADFDINDPPKTDFTAPTDLGTCERGAVMQPTPTPAAKKMSLAAVKRGKQVRPWRILLYAPEGLGKSTFGAATPAPIFLGAEDGIAHLDVASFPTPDTWEDVLAAVATLTEDRGEFKTLVIDTVDWMEPLLWAYICKRDKKANVEDYGYGKGYQAALDEWRILLARLEGVRAKGMNVLLLGHTHVKPFKSPDTEDFDRYELKIHLKAGGLLKEWVDAVLFANHETYTKADPRTKRVRGISSGARLIYTTRTAAYDAKNRFDLPEAMALSWPDVEAAMNASAVDMEELLKQIAEKAEKLGGEDKKKAVAAITRANGDAVKLNQLNSWCNSQLILKAQAAEKAV